MGGFGGRHSRRFRNDLLPALKLETESFSSALFGKYWVQEHDGIIFMAFLLTRDLSVGRVIYFECLHIFSWILDNETYVEGVEIVWWLILKLLICNWSCSFFLSSRKRPETAKNRKSSKIVILLKLFRPFQAVNKLLNWHSCGRRVSPLN